MKRRYGKAGKPGINIIICAAVLAVVLLLATFTAYTAFMGAGNRKGVAAANTYFFTSNVLSGINNENDTLSSYSCSDLAEITRLNVQIRNYNTKRIANPFEVTYTLKCKLSEAPKKAANGTDYYTYAVEYTDPQTNTVASQAVASCESWVTLGTNFKLASSELDADSFTVVFNRGTNLSDVTKAVSVCIIAVPTDPAVMKTYKLGASISLSVNQIGFSVSSGFTSDITDINDMAGFSYEISTSGVIPSGETPRVKIEWNTDMLELDPNCVLYSKADAVVGYATDGDGNQIPESIEINISSGEYYRIAFYRTDLWSTVSVTLTDLLTYVQTTRIA